MKKIYILSIALLGIVFLGGCNKQPVIQTEQQTNPQPTVETSETTTDQPKVLSGETYSNIKWGFEFNYPSGYNAMVDLEKETELDISVRKINDPEEAKNSDGVCESCTFRIQVLPKFIGGSGDFKTPDEWVKFQKDLGQTYTKTTLAGQTTYTITNQETQRKIYLIYVLNGTMYDRYDISIKANDGDADMILSSFNLIR